jgi:hypothetical protein
LQFVPTLQIQGILAAQSEDLFMNDDDLPRTDVLDDDGAPQDARRHVPPRTITDGKEREPFAPAEPPDADDGKRIRRTGIMNRTSILGAGAAMLLATAPTLAQTTQVAPTATSNRPIALTPSFGSPAAVPMQSSTPSAFREMRPGELIGESIYNTGGESLGKIEDIVVNRNDKTVAALVGMGGFLGLGVGDKPVAVLLSDLEMQGGNIVVKALTRTDFQQRAAYQTNDWARYDRGRLIGDAVR